MKRIPAEIYLALIVTVVVKCITASGKFDLQVLKVVNPRNELSSGKCCGPSGARDSGGVCQGSCANVIKVCLQEYQSVTRSGADTQDLVCKLGNATSGVLRPVDAAADNTDQPVVHLILPFDFAWTVSAACFPFCFCSLSKVWRFATKTFDCVC